MERYNNRYVPKIYRITEKKLPEDQFNVEVVCVLCNVKKEMLSKFKYKDLSHIGHKSTLLF